MKKRPLYLLILFLTLILESMASVFAEQAPS